MFSRTLINVFMSPLRICVFVCKGVHCTVMFDYLFIFFFFAALLSSANAHLLLLFLHLLHFKGAHGESWGAPSIWALIEAETDKLGDKEMEKNFVCACVCVCACMRERDGERDGLRTR